MLRYPGNMKADSFPGAYDYHCFVHIENDLLTVKNQFMGKMVVAPLFNNFSF